METSTFDARPAGGAIDAGASAAAARPDAPQLRTLLLTDLCDSTTLVERLGDAPAADLFREHDALVLRLQQQWRARLIDRSDGLLLLFERPIDGLGFALDYTRGLRDIGASRGHVLQARAGLHVGEVLTWRNSEEAVRVGAKPLEVEGLAKPMAGRLMAMARPGQILLSAVAEPLTHRAARELGTRGEQLVWKSHGRWRFKGVPQAQEIFEVGEPALAPLRAPASTPKAWRDIPLWRRPAALAAQAAVLGAIAVGTWFALRPQPAIAFGERDWVVVADLRNLTGQPVLDESLEQAFRISLEQSRYVNVLSDLKARDTLARMRRPADTKLDRAIASEIALRDGARAVILPTVAEVGGRVRVSAEIIDPRTQATVDSYTAEGRGISSVLSSVDDVVVDVRSELGESLQAIRQESVPLEKVTTESLDALRAYTLGVQAYSVGDSAMALDYFEKAIGIDPEFALAHMGMLRIHVSHAQWEQARQAFARASQTPQALPKRDALYLDAWSAEFDASSGSDRVRKWRALAGLYPDHYGAHANLGWALFGLGRYPEAIRATQPATHSRNPLWPLAQDQVGRMQLAAGHIPAALRSFEKASRTGKLQTRQAAAAFAAQGDLDRAREAIAKMPAGDLPSTIEKVTFAVVTGDEQARMRAFEDARAQGESTYWQRFLDAYHLLARTADPVHAPPTAKDFDRALREMLDVHDAAHVSERSAYLQMALAVAYGALRAGHLPVALHEWSRLHAVASASRDERALQMQAVLRGQHEIALGNPRGALAAIGPLLNGTELFQARVVERAAYEALGQTKDVQRVERWLSRHQGLAYAEQYGGYVLQTLNVSDSRAMSG